MKKTLPRSPLFAVFHLSVCALAAAACSPDPGGDDNSVDSASATTDGGGSGGETIAGTSAPPMTGGAQTGDGTTAGGDEESGSSTATGSGEGVRIARVERGDRYTFAVGEDGSLYGWGALPVVGMEEVPIRFDVYDNALNVTTGEDTFVLLADGSAVVFNGHDEPTPVPLDDVVAVETGEEGAHCAIAGPERALYCCDRAASIGGICAPLSSHVSTTPTTGRQAGGPFWGARSWVESSTRSCHSCVGIDASPAPIDGRFAALELPRKSGRFSSGDGRGLRV